MSYKYYLTKLVEHVILQPSTVRIHRYKASTQRWYMSQNSLAQEKKRVGGEVFYASKYFKGREKRNRSEQDGKKDIMYSHIESKARPT